MGSNEIFIQIAKLLFYYKRHRCITNSKSETITTTTTTTTTTSFTQLDIR